MAKSSAQKKTVHRTPGKFVWTEIHAKNKETPVAFYPEVLGWKVGTMPMPDGDYTMFLFGDGEHDSVGGLGSPADDAPAHWLGWMSVADVDASAQLVLDLGGSVITEPMDFPIGRFATVADPSGAVFHLMNSAQGDAPDVPSREGMLHWMELWTKDAAKVAEFYAKLLGFTVTEMQMQDGAPPYLVLNDGDVPRLGIMTAPEPNIPAMWLPYFHTDDADAAAERTTRHGGELMGPVMEVDGVGRFHIAKDPDGALFAFITPAG